ncbi:MAG: hypothetical protein ACT4PV_01835 [Planctomycetaceae bacterium]
MRASALFSLLLVAVAVADEGPAPGKTNRVIEGLDTWLLVPDEIDKEKPASLVLILHGLGGTASGMAATLALWEDDGYVVCAPKSKGDGWSPADIKAVLRIGAHLKATLPIDPAKVHVVGYSNGGWNLASIAFDDDLHPCSATWVAAGYNGGAVPKWARKGMGALALAGADDPNADAARKTVDLLREKVRSVEVRLQPGLGHSWPNEHEAYLRWWMGAQEGRFVPGEDRNFDWGDDLEAALARVEGAKKGGLLVYLFSADDAAKPEAKALQNEILGDPLVRRFGAQLACVKLDASAHPEVMERVGAAETPAVAVLKKDGKLAKLLTGKIKAQALASALRAVAPDKSLPKD